jgi:hypothetical protein
VIPALLELCVDRHSPYLGKIKIKNGLTITVFHIEESEGEGNTLRKQILQSKLTMKSKYICCTIIQQVGWTQLGDNLLDQKLLI